MVHLHTTDHEVDMRSFVFQITMEEDGDGWHVHVPALKKLGASTWGATREQALEHIQEVLSMIVDELIEDGEDPASYEGVGVTEGVAVAVAR